MFYLFVKYVSDVLKKHQNYFTYYLTKAVRDDRILSSIEARGIKSNGARMVCQGPHRQRGIRRRGGVASHTLVDGNNISATVAENAECYQTFDGCFIGDRLFLFKAANNHYLGDENEENCF